MPNRLDSIISKAKGAVKGVEARREGLVGVFATLARQHGEVASLIERCKRDASKRDGLWPKIRTALLAHERAEMRELYPVLRSAPLTHDLAEHHDHDANRLETLIDRLDSIELASTTWGEVFEQLSTAVLRHAHEEEQQIFPVAQEAIGTERADELDAKFAAEHKRLMHSA